MSVIPAPLLAAVVVTLPSNELIRRAIKPNEDDPRMPAILEDEDWPAWLGEEGATPADAKAVLKTIEGVN
jgi:putative SOS response-associated peptidase YedK